MVHHRGHRDHRVQNGKDKGFLMEGISPYLV
jgi:hypothetical protein